MTSDQNDPFDNVQVRLIGSCLRICHLNVEGISASKSQFLHKLLTEQKIDVLAVQETHTENSEQLVSRGNIPEFILVGATYHKHYGIATYTRADLKDVVLQSTSTRNDIHEVVIKVGDIHIINIYKPPLVPWPDTVLDVQPHPSVYVGDFNSHHELWRYDKNDENGESLVNWSELNHTCLIFDAKDHSTFHSAAWKKDYNPDLCFVSMNPDNEPLPTSRKVISNFPRSQHRPVVIQIGLSIPLVNSHPHPRWNLAKADWNKYAVQLDKTLGWIPPTSQNYNRFCKAVWSSAKKSIPRGYRKEYIPGWNKECDTLYHQYLENGDQKLGDALLTKLDEARRAKWTKTVEEMDFKHSSRKAWSLLRKIQGNKNSKQTTVKVTPNQIAAHIVDTSRAPRDRSHTIEVKKDFKTLKTSCPPSDEYSSPFTEAEINIALAETKTNKAPGFDGIHPEFLKYCGPFTIKWLAKFFTNILQTGIVPAKLKSSKIIALLKPGKPEENPKSYRPIALLSCLYKLLERVIYNRISPKLFEVIPVEQAGFRPGRNCTDQVLALTTHIEAGFQRKLKSSAAFVDLSAAYDTVWREGLLFKFLRVIPCLKMMRLLNNMLANRSFQVCMADSMSRSRTLNNGLAQGSVLAPVLFGLYISDIPDTTSVKFGYADDWALVTKHEDLKETESILSQDLNIISSYFRKWRLQPNPSKTEISCFHLTNTLANSKLNVTFEGVQIDHNPNPKYLGVTLDRTLSFKTHLSKLSQKVQTRINIIQKLCSSSWGSRAPVLRTSALSLVYSTAEYCAPVWLNSAHVNLIDVQLNNTMRLISGAIRPTPTHWLPILSHIQPPTIRRHNNLLREFKKIQSNKNLPIHQDLPDLDIDRLASRHPPMRSAMKLMEDDFDPIDQWRTSWNNTVAEEIHQLPCIDTPPPGFELPRRSWVALNRIRTKFGNCADMKFKWGMISSPECDCGAERQTMKHIVEECPLRSYPGNVQDFLVANENAIDYIKNLDLKI